MTGSDGQYLLSSGSHAGDDAARRQVLDGRLVNVAVVIGKGAVPRPVVHQGYVIVACPGDDETAAGRQGYGLPGVRTAEVGGGCSVGSEGGVGGAVGVVADEGDVAVVVGDSCSGDDDFVIWL